MKVGRLVWHLDSEQINAETTIVGREPRKSSDNAMAFDFYSPKDLIIPGASVKDGLRSDRCEIGKAIVDTLVSAVLPKDCALMLGSRSSLAGKYHLTVEAGWIDNDYRGNIGVVLYNHGEYPREIKAGDRIAQGMLVPMLKPKTISVEYGRADVSETNRGAGGFGSTGR